MVEKDNIEPNEEGAEKSDTGDQKIPERVPLGMCDGDDFWERTFGFDPGKFNHN